MVASVSAIVVSVDGRDPLRRAPAGRAALVRAKIAAISSDPHIVARIRQVTSDINARIGAYLALKTVLSILLGAPRAGS